MNQTKEQILIEQIKTGKFSEKELIALYKNATDKNAPLVIDAVKKIMRGQFPRAAKRLFGAKESQATALLEGAYKKLSAELNFKHNKLKNGIKPGGVMLSGESYICVYLSYKNKGNFGAHLGLLQSAADSELIAEVANYKTGNDSFNEKQSFGVHDFDKAVALYRQYLIGIIESS